ncbi:MAG: N-acetylglucosamine repressor [Firmicutes bacterium ADurb.Bin300]|nr:MAG: N-acetylglucosamine repressor [Firmicutes bacterium ADurb.Bin300]
MDILCLDIGGTKLSGAIADENGNLRSISTVPLFSGQDAKRIVMEAIFDFADRVIDRNPEIKRIGISVPGLTDSEKGIWIFSPFSGIKDLNLRERLGERYNIPIYAENDVNSCALAEKRFGVCKDEQNFMWITISYGIGGSFVINGSLFKGTNGNAGEIGHIVVDENGPACGCGNKGCLEAVASCNAIENAYLASHPGEKKTVEELIAKTFMGDNEVAKMFYDAGYYVGKAAASAATLLDIGTLVFGGVQMTYELMEDGIAAGIDRFAFRKTGLLIKKRKTGLGNQAALYGAATVALNGD